MYPSFSADPAKPIPTRGAYPCASAYAKDHCHMQHPGWIICQTIGVYARFVGTYAGIKYQVGYVRLKWATRRRQSYLNLAPTSTMTRPLENKLAIITGASRGMYPSLRDPNKEKMLIDLQKALGLLWRAIWLPRERTSLSTTLRNLQQKMQPH